MQKGSAPFSEICAHTRTHGQHKTIAEHSAITKMSVLFLTKPLITSTNDIPNHEWILLLSYHRD